MSAHRWTRENWPIAAAMIPYPNQLPDGSLVQDAPPEIWKETLEEIADAGFTELDPTDSWLRVADLTPERRNDFMAIVAELGMTIPALSTARRSVIDPKEADENLDYSHRAIDVAAEIGASEINFGLFGPLTEAQKNALWFWTEDGFVNPNDPAIYRAH